MSSEQTPPKRGRGRPATGQVPIRNVRVPDELWHAALAAAHEDGTTVTAWIVEDLRKRLSQRQRQLRRIKRRQRQLRPRDG